MSNIFPDILTSEMPGERNMEFRKALFGLMKKSIDVDNFGYLVNIYTSSKQLDVRNKILKLLYDFDFFELKEFFQMAYKKERYLDMKINALRGLTKFVSEADIASLVEKFNQSLIKRQETTPFNYQEYELLRGKNSLPYLIDKYNYKCFKETLSLVNKQYESMPDAFKGHFTTDKDGEIVNLRKPEEVKVIIEKYFTELRKRP